MLVLVVSGLTTGNYFSPSVEDAISDYFNCEAGGSVPDKCSKEYQAIQSLSFPYLLAIILLLLGSVPLMNLLFVVNWKYLKEKLQWCREQAVVYQTLEGNDSETQPSRAHAEENYKAVAI